MDTKANQKKTSFLPLNYTPLSHLQLKDKNHHVVWKYPFICVHKKKKDILTSSNKTHRSALVKHHLSFSFLASNKAKGRDCRLANRELPRERDNGVSPKTNDAAN